MDYSRGILIGIAASLLVAGSYVIAQEEEEHQIHHPEAQENPGDPGTDDVAGGGMMGPGAMRDMTGGAMKPCRMMQRGMGGGMMGGTRGSGMAGSGRCGGMMGGGMMGGGRCGGMMGGGMMHGGMMDRMIHIPMLPPGNEKLQLMMQAEILQKVGEVQAKYAAQIKESAAPAP